MRQNVEPRQGRVIVDVYLVGAKNPETGRQIRAQRSVNPHFHVVGFIDNDPDKRGTTFLDLPVVGGFDVVPSLAESPDAYFVNLITGDARVRDGTTNELLDMGARLTNLIHPSVDLTDVTVGSGLYVQDGVIIQAGVRIEDNVSIHMGALIGHETSIGRSTFVAHAVSVSGEVTIGRGAFIGTNATLLPRVTVGDWAVVGAGSVVNRPVPDEDVVVGSPAKSIRRPPPG